MRIESEQVSSSSVRMFFVTGGRWGTIYIPAPLAALEHHTDMFTAPTGRVERRVRKTQGWLATEQPEVIQGQSVGPM